MAKKYKASDIGLFVYKGNRSAARCYKTFLVEKPTPRMKWILSEFNKVNQKETYVMINELIRENPTEAAKELIDAPYLYKTGDNNLIFLSAVLRKSPAQKKK
jgi:hypothetical protein